MFNFHDLLKVIDPEPVRIDAEACLAARHRQSQCRRCIEACPSAALSLQQGKVAVSTADCMRCGLCAGVCPTAAVLVHGIDDGALLAAPSAHCSQATASGLALPCLGYLTVDHLLTMAVNHEVVELTCGDCAGCPRQAGGERAQQAVALAHAVLAAMGSSHIIRLSAASGEPAETPSLSRRDLFSLWRTESTQVARQFLPEKELNHAKLPARLPVRRTRWLLQLNPDEIPENAAIPPGPWKAREVGDACTGCGICAAFCPTGALAAESEGTEWHLTHQPAACVDCGTCVALCPVRAVGEGALTLSDMVSSVRREIVRRTTRRCRTCRRDFKGRPGEEQCPSCRSVFGSLF